MNSPSYAILTYGCQMNINDSERLASILESVGFHKSDSEIGADLVIFNTCSVRESAEQRIYGKMQELLNERKTGHNILIAVTGCMAGRDKDGVLRKRLHHADLFFSTPDMINLPRWIAELRPDWQIQGDLEDDYLKINPLRNPSAQAFITIQTGCNHFCTYCVVPYARGLIKNRPLADILNEVKELSKKGVLEVTLLGQTVNTYKAGDPETFSPDNPYQNHFAGLLWELNQISGLERIHWTAPHPMQMTDQVIHALTLPKQINYLHLPVQSGSNEMLRRMNRKYTREQYLEIIKKIKDIRPGIALGTDIIVGFSGETEKDFADTLNLFSQCDFDISYNAQYSPRTGTLAHRLYKDDVSANDKKLRWRTLQELMEKTTLKKNQEYMDKITQVLIQKIEGDVAFGLSNEYKNIKVKGANEEMIGRIVPVKITKPLTWVLEGELLSTNDKDML
ncbi:tRNA (N6-isopentenyl adenosine(37)-C2)-methylthiotransferase MiaB [Patescibacteria group bacterium]|nr:tRNA (N6-isopentenyl adenosine(37)-C2)-methylthiotransferase MiaB [Patescibacteria group bacterium]